MALIKKSYIKDVTGFEKDEEAKKAIINFIQGAVYCWCKNRKEEWFSMRDLMGGDNYYWKGTPLYDLYVKHKDSEDAVNLAGQDAGWLLKRVLEDDKRRFDAGKTEDGVSKYKWDGDCTY